MNKSKNAPLKSRLIQYAIDIFIGFLKLFPRPSRRKVIAFIAHTILACASRTRNRALYNLSLAMPNATSDELLTYAKDSYANVVLGVTETFWLQDLDLIVVCDEQAKTILSSGESVCVAAMHMGCVEAVPLAVEQLTGRSTTMSNIPKNMRFAHELYQNVGINVIDRNQKNAFFELIKQARKNEIISLHSDFFGEEVDVSLFGKSTTAPAGIATLSALTSSPLLIAYSLYTDDASCYVYFETFSDTPVSKVKQDMHDAIKGVYRRFEEIILAHPNNWYWSYNRFKTSRYHGEEDEG